MNKKDIVDLKQIKSYIIWDLRKQIKSTQYLNVLGHRIKKEGNVWLLVLLIIILGYDENYFFK